MKYLNSIYYKHSTNLENLSITFERNEMFIQCASDILETYGVLVIKDFYPRSDSLKLGTVVNSDIKQYVSLFKSSCDYKLELDKLYGQIGLVKFKNYQEIASAGKPVLNVRSDDVNIPDAGFIDLFGAEKLFSGNNSFTDCISSMRSKWVRSIVENVTNYKKQQINLYINDGITNTRGAHVDNTLNSYKCFLYLTDVKSNDDGPYSYVPGSHKGKILKKINIKVNKFFNNMKQTDIPVYESLPLELTGSAGTLIISNQSGIHCGHPQIEAASRVVLVDNYY